jgi:hypothetical protein
MGDHEMGERYSARPEALGREAAKGSGGDVKYSDYGDKLGIKVFLDLLPHP